MVHGSEFFTLLNGTVVNFCWDNLVREKKLNLAALHEPSGAVLLKQ